MTISRQTIRFALWACAGLFLVLLAARDVQLDRKFEAHADSVENRSTPSVTSFGPPPRVALTPATSGVLLIGEPVYADVRLPRWFERVTLTLRYDNDHGVPFRVGVRTHPELWQFDVKTVDGGVVNGAELVVHPDVLREMDGTVRIPFTLERSWQVERNVYRFIFSAPGISAERPIVIRDLTVTAERDAMCFMGVCL
ncbi:MAG: hypothetical protein Q7S96_04630 [bacterium]|nr:hypothetical protein [bacterium]